MVESLGLRWSLAALLLLLAGCSPDVSPVATSASATPDTDRWRPAPGAVWQWQLGDDEIDLSVEADIFDLDLYVDEAVIEDIHARGGRVICYVSVGSWEDWRPDAAEFPAQILGKDYEGWPGERWLDVRRIDLLAPILAARLDQCVAKGFDGVEPDNIDIHMEDTGFALSYADQLSYARWLADEAHTRGLAIGIKNAPDMVGDSIDFFDFAVTEDAYDEGWIGEMLLFVETGKAVLAAEYTDTEVDFSGACSWGREHGVSFILKNRDLDAWRGPCP
jgi:endo-alpha-1,4-polygalactosaminidase (GH114 family)